MIHLTIDNIEIEVPEEITILEAARSADIYIPTICSHPDLPPFHSLELSDVIYQSEKNCDVCGKTLSSYQKCEHKKLCKECFSKINVD